MPTLMAYPFLLAAGIVSLPLAAYFFDGSATENWVLPIQLLAMAAIGALVGWVTPGLGRPTMSTTQRVLFGVLLGLLAAILGVVLLFLLISGFRGA